VVFSDLHIFKKETCRKIDPYCIQCISDSICTQCAYPYHLFSNGAKCDSYGVISISTETLSYTEGDNIEIRIVREYGSVGDAKITLTTSYIENINEMRVLTKNSGSYFERKNIEITFLDGEILKTIYLTTYKDTINEKVPKKMAINIEFKEGVSISIGRRQCIVNIYDPVVPDSYYSNAQIAGYEGKSLISHVSPGQQYTMTVNSYIEKTAKKTDGVDKFFVILEKMDSVDPEKYDISQISESAYQALNVYNIQFKIPDNQPGKYRVNTFIGINGVLISYYRNMVFSESVHIERIESCFPRVFTEEIKSSLISVQAKTLIKIDTTGIYTFYLSGSKGDKLKLWINNQNLLNIEQPNPVTLISGTQCGSNEQNAQISLTAGFYYQLILEYVHGEGEPCINLRWSKPNDSTGPNDISLSKLFSISPISGASYLLYTD